MAFSILEMPAKTKTCKAMKGLIAEGKEAIGEKRAGSGQGREPIGAAQRVEHYEIAAYGTARTFAELLGEMEIAALLTETVQEEAATDEKLTGLSKSINQKALHSFAV